jgi:hypothetical protein
LRDLFPFFALQISTRASWCAVKGITARLLHDLCKQSKNETDCKRAKKNPVVKTRYDDLSRHLLHCHPLSNETGEGQKDVHERRKNDNTIFFRKQKPNSLRPFSERIAESTKISRRSRSPHQKNWFLGLNFLEARDTRTTPRNLVCYLLAEERRREPESMLFSNTKGPSLFTVGLTTRPHGVESIPHTCFKKIVFRNLQVPRWHTDSVTGMLQLFFTVWFSPVMSAKKLAVTAMYYILCITCP